MNSNAVTGPAFVVGTDAPLASVTSFTVQVQSINAMDAGGNSVPLLSGSPTVDFARYNGLQTLIDMNDVPVGTYTSISITLGPATIGYLNTPVGSAPTIQTMPATLSTSTVKVKLGKPLVVAQAEPVGINVDLDLRQSIQLDANGQVTGQVAPTFDVHVVAPTEADAHIDEFEAAVVSVNAAAQSFVIQGPHGRQFTVNVNGQTEWENNESLSSLTTSSVVQVSGTLEKEDATVDADEVAIVSQNNFYADGLVTHVQPAQGTATNFDIYVRGVLPTTTGLTLGQIAQVNLTGQEKYYIYWMHNPLTAFLFNSGALLPGQEVAIGGPASGAANAQAVTVNRVMLRNWGYNGTVVNGSVNQANDTFQMQVNGFAGTVIPEKVTVYVSGMTGFRKGFNAMRDVQGGANARVVGLLLKDPGSGQAAMLARYVDLLQ